MSGTLLHRAVIEFARLIYEPYLRIKYKYKFEKVDYRKGNFIALANHTTNLDSMILGISFKQHMYFVAGEQLFRMGFVSTLLRVFLNPIKRMKAKTEAKTAVNMLKALKAGHNICMFPEGSCTWNGETSTIIPSTAKLIKRAGVTLITYRVEGGYPTMPRWSKSIRPGRMTGVIGNVYEPEQLEKMTVEEIYKAICDDLYVNSINMSDKYEYEGKTLAENLETALFICPKCHGISTCVSKDDMFTCSCGVRLRYDKHCILHDVENQGFPFSSVLEWDKWQRQWIIDNIASLKDNTGKVITEDANQDLYTYTENETTEHILTGTMALYSDRFVFTDINSNKEIAVKLEDITDIAIVTMTTLTFSCSDIHYEVKCKMPRSALKYLLIATSLSPMRYII
ncbi:MAG: lysophospholipid acyltransferase family protein [Clostridia bacterium]|jgi:1-acyl-sn-glycerol-3-phosphate acyltransferase